MSERIVFIPQKKDEKTFVFDTALFCPQDRLWLAPMQGLTELFFRKAFAECFPDCIDCAVTPFISVTHGDISKSVRKFRDAEPATNIGSLRIVPQLLGEESENVLKYALHLNQMGYGIVNLNLACPSSTVTKRNRGAAILKDYRKVDMLLKRLTDRQPFSLSLKIRLGFDSKKDLGNLAEVLNNYPLHSVIVHPRLAVQMYDGKVDLEGFDFVYQHLHHRLIYNGDIVSGNSFIAIKERFPQIHDFMIGRAFIGNPFLAARLKYGNTSHIVSLYDFYDKLQKYYVSYSLGIEHTELLPFEMQEKINLATMNKMKEFCRYFAFYRHLDDKIFTRAKTLTELNSIVFQTFQ